LVVNLAHAILKTCVGFTSSPLSNISAIGKAVDFFRISRIGGNVAACFLQCR